MNTFIVIPAYNEQQTIEQVIKGVQKICSNIVVVDDCSSDNTRKTVKNLGVTVLHHIVNRGQGASLQTGFAYALKKGADRIITFDADGQHEPAYIEKFLKLMNEQKVDVVLGSRFLDTKINKMPLRKRIVRKLGALHQWFFSGLRVTDSQCGLRALNRKAAEAIVIRQDRMSHSSEILDQIARQKLKYIEVPVRIKDTAYSLKKSQKGFSGSLRIIYDFFMGRIV